MRVIITGGTGVIGTELVRQLAAEKQHEIIVLSRNPNRYWAKFPGGVKIYQWDGRTGNGWHDLIDSSTAIINLAGENPAASLRWTQGHKDRVMWSRIHAGEAVNDAVSQAKALPRVLLQASAVGYYGNRADLPLTEDVPPGEGFRADVCKVWERVTDNLPIRQAQLRIGIVLDREGGALPPFILASYFGGRRLGSGRQWLPWIHLYDTAAAIRYLMLHDSAQGAFNLVAPYPVTNEHFMRAIGLVTGRLPIFPIPAFPLKQVLGEMADTMLDSQRVIPERLRQMGYQFRYPKIEDALRDLLK
jgi:uncharacterized protein